MKVSVIYIILKGNDMKNKLVIAAVCSAVFALVSSDSEAARFANSTSAPQTQYGATNGQTQYGTTGGTTQIVAATMTLAQIPQNQIDDFNNIKGFVQKSKKLNASLSREAMGCLAKLTGAFVKVEKTQAKLSPSNYFAVGSVFSKEYYASKLSDAELVQLGYKLGLSFNPAKKNTAYRTINLSVAWQ